MSEAEDMLDRISQKLDRVYRKNVIWKQALEFCANHAHDATPSVIQDVAKRALAYNEKSK